MSERALTVYSVEARDFLEQSGFLLKVDFSDGRVPAHYAVDNMFELEGWERFKPEEFSFRRNSVKVLGKFASLTEMRTNYLEGREKISKAELALLKIEAEEQPYANEYDFESEYDKTSNTVKLALHQATLDRVCSLAIQNGANEDIVISAKELAENDMYTGENSEFRQQIIDTNQQLTEHGLWVIFEAQEAADNIEVLVEWFEKCKIPPYTFYRDLWTDGASLDEEIEDPYHIPRVKVSSELIQNALQELLEDTDKFDTAGLIDDVVLARAREIASAHLY